jgi:hypothetical protein
MNELDTSLPRETRLKRRLGYSNEMMYNQCLILQKVVTQTKTLKSGRGKKVESRDIPKYRIPKDVLDKINNSVEYYKKQMSSKLEFRDYQTEIIAKGMRMFFS